mmetsp:Transcript_4932/g.9130  ORF Transcript_4932/g.9130 Transcript_4932/m.9130 type:complete len:239 (-) Transcript_4932:117-833(-)
MKKYLGLGCIKNTLNGRIETGIKVVVAHGIDETLEESTRETCNHSVLTSKNDVGLVTRVSARQGHNTDNIGMIDALLVKVINRRKTEFEHDLVIWAECVEVLKQVPFEENFSLSLFRRLDVDLWFKNRNKSSSNNLFANLKLLVNNFLHTLGIGHVDDRTHLGSKHAKILCTFEKIVESRNRLHELNSIFFWFKTFIYLQDGNNSLDFPKVRRSRLAVDLAIHCILEQNGGKNAITVE